MCSLKAKNLKFHLKNTIPKKRLFTMMTFTTNNPESCGIVSINNEGIVENFYEKENGENGNIANAAIYCFNDNLINFLQQCSQQKLTV